MIRRKRKPGRRKAVGFYVEDDVYYSEPVTVVGSLISDWGPLEAPRRTWPWNNHKPEPAKPAFGFSRALED